MVDRINGRRLSLEVDGDEWAGDVLSYTLAAADGTGDVTFAEAANGLSGDYTLTLTVKQDFTAGTAYRYAWDHLGDEDVAVVLAPYGNAAASTAQPHVTFLASMPVLAPNLGGTASTDTKSDFTADFVLSVKSGTVPVLVSTP